MADQRIQYNERLVGAGHPTLADTINRLALVEHNSDGTHKFGKLLAAQHTAASVTGTTSETTLFSAVIPGGTLGLNGRLRVMFFSDVTNNANGKTFRVRLGGAQLAATVVSSQKMRGFCDTINRNSQNSQITYFDLHTLLSTVAYTTSAVDTSVDQTLAVSAQLANAADTATIEAADVIIWRP